MTLLKEPITSSGDDLDNLLRAFFQAEMPQPWPAVEVPSRPLLVVASREEEPPTRSSSSLVRSRLALAASVALLVSGPLFFASALRDTGTDSIIPGHRDGDKAEREKLNTPRSTENPSNLSLQVTPDGVIIRVDVSEPTGSK